jgi:hypothetical protein
VSLANEQSAWKKNLLRLNEQWINMMTGAHIHFQAKRKQSSEVSVSRRRNLVK